MLSSEEFERQLLAVDALIQPPGGWGNRNKWFRPGCGTFAIIITNFMSRTSINDELLGWYNGRMLRTASKHGYRTVLGDCFPYDVTFRNATIVTNWVKHRVRSGSIVILHDGGPKRRFTVDVLSRLLPHLRDQ